MITALVFFLILSILVLIHELGHFLVAKKNNVLVEEFGFGLPPRIWGKKIGETLYSINWLPFGGFVKLLGEEEHELEGKTLPANLKKRTFSQKSHLVKASILVAGVCMNFLLGWVVMTILLTQGIPVPSDRVTIGQVVKNSPAYNAGLKLHDIVASVIVQNKTYTIKAPEDLSGIASKYAGTPLTLKITRGTQSKDIIVIPRKHPPRGEGSMGIGISNVEEKKYPWYTAPYFALIESFVITKTILVQIIATLIKFVTFQKISADIAGPIGVYQVTGEAVKFGFQAILNLLGILSFNLAIVNILPFPALDGGRLAMVVIEAVTRKKINPKIEANLNMVGFAVLLGFIVLISVHDVFKFIVK